MFNISVCSPFLKLCGESGTNIIILSSTGNQKQFVYDNNIIFLNKATCCKFVAVWADSKLPQMNNVSKL
jgi:hypothetical protein